MRVHVGQHACKCSFASNSFVGVFPALPAPRYPCLRMAKQAPENPIQWSVILRLKALCPKHAAKYLRELAQMRIHESRIRPAPTHIYDSWHSKLSTPK